MRNISTRLIGSPKSLEERCTPANLFWNPLNGVSGNFSTAANWDVGMVGGPLAAAAPWPNDTANFTNPNIICNVDVNATVNDLEISNICELVVNSVITLTVQQTAGGNRGTFNFTGGLIDFTDSTSSLILNNATGTWGDNANFVSDGNGGLLEITGSAILNITGSQEHDINATLQVSTNAAKDTGYLNLLGNFTGNINFEANGTLAIMPGGTFESVTTGTAQMTFAAGHTIVQNAGFFGESMTGSIITNADINNYTDGSVVGVTAGGHLEVHSISQARGITGVLGDNSLIDVDAGYTMIGGAFDVDNGTTNNTNYLIGNFNFQSGMFKFLDSTEVGNEVDASCASVEFGPGCNLYTQVDANVADWDEIYADNVTVDLGAVLYVQTVNRFPAGQEVAPIGSPNPITYTAPATDFTKGWADWTGTNALNTAYKVNTNLLWHGSYYYNLTAVVRVKLDASVNPSTFGQAVTFTATLTGGSVTPTGTVTFYDGTTPLGTATVDEDGVATFTTSTLSVGDHAITAVYSGDSNYDDSTSVVLTQEVDQAATSVSLSSSLNPASFGQNVTFTATVAPSYGGTPTGTVSFYDGNTLLATVTLDNSGTAIFMTSSLSVGTHSLTAVYNGDSNFASSTSAELSESILLGGPS